MCSLMMALTGLTTGLQMAGQYQQSRAQAAAYEAQAQAARDNAKIQNRQSEQIAENAIQEQRKLDARMRLIAGQNNAQAGASGIMGNVGSPLDIYNASMEAWGEDTQNALWNQRNNTYNSYVKEVNFRNQANSYDAQAKAAKQAGNMALAGGAISLLGAASSSGMFGKSGASNTATAQTPTAAGYVPNAMDTAFGGVVSGYSPVTKGVFQGATQSFGPLVLQRNPYGTGINTAWNWRK